MPTHLRFCPICVEKDKNEYGETYWHRLHQLPGVLVCPDHLCFLENSSLEWKRGTGSQFFLAADYILSRKPRFLKQKDEDHQVLIKLAENAWWLLNQSKLNLGTKVIRDRYYNQLLKNKLAYYNGRIRNNKLLKAFQDFYSPSLLETLGCSVESSHRSWIFRIVEKSKTDMIHHPIRHLMMMNFLGFSAEEFFTSFVEFNPFVDGPYPCLSRASDHFGELRIQKCDIFDNLNKGKRKGIPVAVFSCDCGFIYQRIGPDKSEEDRFRYSSIREYGTIWENKLREMWNDLSLSRAEIARRLQISDLSVTNIAHRLKFPMNTPGTRVSNDKAHRKPPRRTLTELRKLYRKKWIKVLKDNPQANRNKLIKLANFEYQWLMRNDSEWMNKHLPEVLKIDRKKEFLDWRKIDDEMSVKVEKACQEIYSAIPLKRVCITEVIRIAGNKAWLEKHEEKLPKTTRILNGKLETFEDYMLRKLKFAEQRFIEEKKIPTRNQLISRAVLNNQTSKTSNRVQEEINNSLKRIENSIYFPKI